jgi:transposase
MSSKHAKYAVEFKEQAVALVRQSDQPASVVAKELGIKVNTLYNWLSQSEIKPLNQVDSEAVAENKRLKKELARVQLERDILKKATAYFAKESL